jgi:F-type H+-transporting ATPase subunit delta
VQVTTARAPSAAALEQLTAALRRVLGFGAVVQTSVDPALIGGLTMRVDDLFVDGSVRRHLGEMKNRILGAPVSDKLWDA